MTSMGEVRGNVQVRVVVRRVEALIRCRDDPALDRAIVASSADFRLAGTATTTEDYASHNVKMAT